MEVRRAELDELATYTTFGRAAQKWLQSRRLGQFVPAAHDEYAAAFREMAESGALYVVRDSAEAIGFFSLSASPSPWWPTVGAQALYLGGIVVARHARGRGVGGFIIDWSDLQAACDGRQFVRLDCHADNSWLRAYYERHGFELQGLVQQRPGYVACLYQRTVAS